MVGDNLCKYGDCCGQDEICSAEARGSYTCSKCPPGTLKIDNQCVIIDTPTSIVPNTTTVDEKTIKTSGTSANSLIGVVAGQELHCPYLQEQFASLLCEDWCKTQELQYGLKCADVIQG